MSEPKISLRHVYKIFGERPQGRALTMAKAGASKDEIQAETGHVVGLNDVTFDVEEGELFVIMGLSGSGKSTAIRTVNKLHDITEGSIRVDGVEVTELKGRALQAFRRDKMGMVFQHFALFPHRSVLDNVGYGLAVQGVEAAERERRSREALGLVGLEAYAEAYPSELSGGMQQRVGLARALAADPDILLMDEAFSALDPLIRRQMQDELLAMQDALLHKTILFITHDLNEALRVGDRVCIMKDGAVVQIGTPEEILTSPATAYVAEFVQDVDQGRVLRVDSVLERPEPLRLPATIDEALGALGDDDARAVVDDGGRPVGLAVRADLERAAAVGTRDLEPALRRDITTTTADTALVAVYEDSARGLPLVVVDAEGAYVGLVEPLALLGELGRIESMADRVKEGAA